MPAGTRSSGIEHAARAAGPEFSSLGEPAGLSGAVHLALDEMFAPHRLAPWLPRSSPVGNPELAALEGMAPAA